MKQRSFLFSPHRWLLAVLSFGLALTAFLAMSLSVSALAPTMTAATTTTADTDNNGTVDRIVITFSELSDIIDGNAGDGLPSLALNSGCTINNANYAANSVTTLTLNLTSCTASDTSITPIITYTSVANCVTAGAICDDAVANQMANAHAVTATDATKPVISSVAFATASNKNTIAWAFTEAMFIDNTNQDGTVDAGDTTSSETFDTTAAIGGIDAAGSIEQFGNFATAGNFTESAATNHRYSIAANGKTITLTLNNTSGAFFLTGTTASSGNFTPDGTNYFMAQAGNTLANKNINTATTPAAGGAGWDVTAPSAITNFKALSVASTTSVNYGWDSFGTLADFGSFILAYGTSAGVGLSSSIWTNTNAVALATNTTTLTTITGLTTSTVYYAKGYARDIAGNVSSASSEINLLVAGASTAASDTTAPGVPGSFAVTLNDSLKPVLSWTDPTDSDLQYIQIVKSVGDGVAPITVLADVAKNQLQYTDMDVLPDKVYNYKIRAADNNANFSAYTATVSITTTLVVVEEEPTIEPVTVDLTGTQSGTATLTEADGAVTVEVVVNDPDTDTTGTTQQAHIHSGTCSETGDIAYVLTDLVDGTSTAVLDGVTLAELELEAAEGGSYINVHDATDATVSTACGNLYDATIPTPEEVAAPEETVEELTSETGTIVEETTLKGANESAYITFSADTTLTTAEGTPFIGTFMSPTLQVGALDGVTPPAGAAFASDVYRFGSEEGTINASKPGTAYFPAGEGYEIDIVNEEYQAFKLGSDEPSATCSVVTSEGATLFRCEFTSFSDYVILAFAAEEEEEEAAEEEEEEEEEVAEAPFTDTKTHWSKDYVADLYAKGIVSGKTTTKYAPDDAVTRAEFTKIIVGAFSIDLVSTTGSFTDISGHWGSKYIEAAKAADVISGYSDKTFKPDAKINRAEALKILLEAADVSLTAAAADFPDVKASDWFAKYVNYAAANAIVKGYADGTFGPNKSITRGEVAKIVSLMIAE